MTFKKGEKEVYIPNWLALVGLLVVDNIAIGALNTVKNMKVLKTLEKQKNLKGGDSA